jgi:enoyl-CoA hydratase/carnithine racemase
MEPLEVAEAHRELLERAQELAQKIAERVSKVLPDGVSTSDPTPLQLPILPPTPPPGSTDDV